jgi:hypothetical protein
LPEYSKKVQPRWDSIVQIDKNDIYSSEIQEGISVEDA